MSGLFLTLREFLSRGRGSPSVMLIEALECRVMLSAATITTLDTGPAAGPSIPVVQVQSLIFDPTRDQLDIVTPTSVQRYDVATGQLLAPLTVGTALGGGDITADGGFLYLTETEPPAGQGIIHKVSLNTGTVTDLTYTPGPGEIPSTDLTIAANGEALFGASINLGNTNFQGIYRMLATGTDTFSQTYVAGYANYEGTKIERSADRTVLSIETYGSVQGMPSIMFYDATTNATTSKSTNELIFPGAALSADGSLLAFDSRDVGGTAIEDRQFNRIAYLSGIQGQLAFDPLSNVLYLEDHGTLRAFDPRSGAQVPGLSPINANLTTSGMIQPSADGQFLFTTESGGGSGHEHACQHLCDWRSGLALRDGRP
jgi:hypothetical protein